MARIAEIVLATGESFVTFLDETAPPFFLLGLLSAVLSFWLEAIGGMASRGKTRTKLDSLASNRQINALKTFLYGDGWSVPKSFFLHYYLAGFFTLVFVFGFWMARLTSESAGKSGSIAHPMTLATKAVLLVCTVHCVRRSYECYAVHKFSSSGRMHVLFYLIAIFYYIFIPAIVVDLPGARLHRTIQTPPSDDSRMTVFVVIGTLFGLWAQYQQYRHHKILADLRQPESRTTNNLQTKTDTAAGGDGISTYKIPYGGWFEFVTCPHYTAEVLIYVAYGILIWADGRLPPLVPDLSKGILEVSWEYRYIVTLSFVFLNLLFAADESHQWYCQKFDEYKGLNRKVMIPFVR